MKIAVITISDRASRGIYEDQSGPAIEKMIRDFDSGIEVIRQIVPDGKENVITALKQHPDADWIITTGGTGPSPRDQTPEATQAFCDRLLPGLAEYFRFKSLEQTQFAVFSRGICGMKKTQYIVNFPGSVSGAQFHTQLLVPLLTHGVDMALGKGH